MRATMCSANAPLAEVEIEGRHVYKIHNVIDTVHLPVALQGGLSVDTLNAWLLKRTIPDQREGLAAARRLFGDFETYRHMASLTDPYWFRYSPRETWGKINFYNNDYSSAVGNAQFTPWDVDAHGLHVESPDLTTNGLLRKVWVHDSQMQSYLVKAGSRELRQYPLSEVLATVSLRKFNLVPFVPYELAIYGMRVCSKCPCFTTAETEFVPAKDIYETEPRQDGDTVYSRMVRAAENYGIQKPWKFLERMILVDMLIGNQDRHLGNFGFLRDVKTGSLTGFAPLFDFGGAFSPDGSSGGKPSPRVFANQAARIQRKYAHLFTPNFFVRPESLYAIIDTYPDLTQREKKKIREDIRQREQFFSHTLTERGARSR